MFSADLCRKALAQMLPANGVTGRRALDLVCLAVLCSGNDYIPAMPSAPLDAVTHPHQYTLINTTDRLTLITLHCTLSTYSVHTPYLHTLINTNY